jgi:hypothetical protein
MVVASLLLSAQALQANGLITHRCGRLRCESSCSTGQKMMVASYQKLSFKTEEPFGCHMHHFWIISSKSQCVTRMMAGTTPQHAVKVRFPPLLTSGSLNQPLQKHGFIIETRDDNDVFVSLHQLHRKLAADSDSYVHFGFEVFSVRLFSLFQSLIWLQIDRSQFLSTTQVVSSIVLILMRRSRTHRQHGYKYAFGKALI